LSLERRIGVDKQSFAYQPCAALVGFREPVLRKTRSGCVIKKRAADVAAR